MGESISGRRFAWWLGFTMVGIGALLHLTIGGEDFHSLQITGLLFMVLAISPTGKEESDAR